MKHLALFLTLLCICFQAPAQNQQKSTNSFFDGSDAKTFAVKSITIQGEVQDPGPVDLSSLPVRSIALKEVGLENGQRVFKGAFFVTGYALYDILKDKNFKKAQDPFAPPVDLYAIVENDQGEKAVFSWGEIYYQNSFNILVTKTVQPINPARAKAAYGIPETPRLICAADLLNVRFLSNPTRITVKSYHGSVPKEKPKDIYSPEFTIVTRTGSFTVRDIDRSIEKRTYPDVGYGHGMGFKGIENVSGCLLKDLLASYLKSTPQMLREWIAVAGAKDGYRSVLSLSEIMNRSDNKEMLLLDQKDSPDRGRYVLYPSADFFADRDVKAVEKLELLGLE